MTAAFVYDAIRTPFGRFGGGLAKIRPDDLAATVTKAVLERSPRLDPERIDEIVFGNATMRLKTGDRVRVDGTAGTVELLS